MLEWELFLGGHAAATDLVRMYAFPRGEHYRAYIETHNAYVLAECGDLPTLDAAKTWCEAEYASLLATELARVRG